MLEYKFLQSIAGPKFKYGKGAVVTLSEEQAALFLKNNVVVLYDDYVKEQKVKAKQKSSLQIEAEQKAKARAELKAKEEAELKAKEEAELKAKEEAELKAKKEAKVKAQSSKKSAAAK